MQLRKLFEDLDDKDEFMPACNFCAVRAWSLAPEDVDTFHSAHVTYHQAQRNHAEGGPRGDSLGNVMAKHGFVWVIDFEKPQPAGHWARKT